MKAVSKQDINIKIDCGCYFTFTKDCKYPCIFRNHDVVRILDNNKEECLLKRKDFEQYFEIEY